MFYYLTTSWFVQVHLPVHLPCYDLPPLYYVPRVITYRVLLLERVTGGVCALQGRFQVGAMFPPYY